MAFNRETFILYQNDFHTGMTETVMQANVELNSASNGTMSMFSQNMQGDFLRETFFKEITGLVRDRDPDDLSDSTADDLVQGEVKAAKVYKSIHVEKALNSWAAIGSSPAQFSFIVGAQQGKAVAVNYLNSSIASLVGALRSEAGLVHDATATTDKTISPKNLNKLRRLMGDNGTAIRAWVMDSTMFYDLVEENIDSGLTNVADAIVYGGSPASLGLPIIVTDSPYLTAEIGGETRSLVLGLTQNAVAAIEAEDPIALSEVVGGKKNLIGRIQTEFTMMCRVSGAAYTGAAKPTTADLADPANWDIVVTDLKSAAGVVGVFDAS